jgi:hypothetical protein
MWATGWRQSAFARFHPPILVLAATKDGFTVSSAITRLAERLRGASGSKEFSRKGAAYRARRRGSMGAERQLCANPKEIHDRDAALTLRASRPFVWRSRLKTGAGAGAAREIYVTTLLLKPKIIKKISLTQP